VTRLARRGKRAAEEADENADVQTAETASSAAQTGTNAGERADPSVSAVSAGEAEATAGSDAEEKDSDARTAGWRGVEWKPVLAFGIAPVLALLLTVVAGYLKWTDSSVRDSEAAAIESVQSATASTIKMLSYEPQTVERDLGAARDGLTGPFRESYTQLTNDVVIPGSKQKNITAVATVPAASSVSASENHAVTLLFVNQTITVGNDAPSNTASAVKVTLDKVAGRWLISDLTPV
jgi:Mce-associated membrane protein